MATVSHRFGGLSHASRSVVRTLLVAAFLTASPAAWGQGAPTQELPPVQPAKEPALPPAPAPAAKPKPAVPAISTDTPDDDSFITDADARKRKADMERELKRIRLKHFGSIRKVEIRQEGIAKVRQYTDPLIYPALVKIFEKEKHDIRVAILDHLLDQNTAEADVTIAWIAAFDRDPVIRSEAIARLTQHVQPGTTPPVRIKYMIVQGLKSSSPEKQLGAAELAETLKFFEAIPWLITAQFGGPGSSSGTVAEPRGDLAYIVIGQQTAFVSDLTPIVGDSAVAFDPTLSTITTGTILKIGDASVTTYVTVIQPVLVRMTSEAWGQPTDGLGYDGREWWGWYRQEYLPYLSAKLAAESREEPAALPATPPTTPPATSPAQEPPQQPAPMPAQPSKPSPSDDGSGTNTPPKR